MSSTDLVLHVLFEDAYLIAVDKPAGIPVQPDPTDDHSLLELVQRRSGAGIGLPHRIDRPVSGVVLFTRTPEALRAVNAAFRDGAVRKTYLAIVEGAPPDEGECRHVLTHEDGRRKAFVHAEGEGRSAVLRFATRARGDRFALVEVLPEGGAFHQIRAQLAAIGHPIKGDVKYGARRGEPDRSIALHAASLAFRHPITNADVRITAPDPQRSIWPALLALRG
ncbi:MAG: RluA family pseudouridine synthase [Flavobacteriales bacterium]